ncbi:MAG: hypothetical protein OEX03_07225 [Gammaproteobacteria bacterium]|nr:hypothetical protein [Gammaproteobacteria bacterium]
MNLPQELDKLISQQTIPEWANWIAQDKDGKWWLYQAGPLQHHCGWYENEIGIYQFLGPGKVRDNWQQQLYRLRDFQQFL